MSGVSSRTHWGRGLAVAVSAGISALAFVAHREVPLLDQFDLAVHETGHLIAAFMPRMVMFVAGSAAQVMFPLAMAAYFWLRRRDAGASGFCLAWAGTSVRDVSVYAGDAVRQALPLIGGGEHDWAYILGPEGFDALASTSAVARTIEVAGAVLCLLGIAVTVATLVPRRAVGAIPQTVVSTTDPWVAAASLPFRYEAE